MQSTSPSPSGALSRRTMLAGAAALAGASATDRKSVV